MNKTTFKDKKVIGYFELLKKYLGTILTLTLFVLFVFVVGIYNYKNNVKLNDNSSLLNLIGQQKTLSQQLSKDILLINQDYSLNENINSSLFSEVERNKKFFDNNLKLLKSGGIYDNDELNIKSEISPLSTYQIELNNIVSAWSPLSNQIDSLSKAYKQILATKTPLEKVLLSRPSKAYMLSDDSSSLPNDNVGIATPVLLSHYVDNNEQSLKNNFKNQLSETTRILKNNNVTLLQTIKSLNNKVFNVMNKEKSFVSDIQKLMLFISVLFFLLLIFFFFNRLINSDLRNYNQQKEKQAILDNVQEGLFLMNADWIVQQEGSRSLSKIFKRDIRPNTSFFDILESIVDAKTAKNAREYVNILFTKNVKESMISSINPLKHIEIDSQSTYDNVALNKKQFLSISFNKIKGDDDKVSQLLVTVRDNSESKKLEEKIKEEKIKTATQFDLLLKIIKADNKAEILQYFKQVQEIICEQNESLKVVKVDESDLMKLLNSIQREIHTLKSEAGILDLIIFQSLFHDFEEKINNIKKKKPIKSEDLHIISFFHKDILEKTASLIEAVETVPIELNAGAQIIQRQSNIHNTLSKLLDKNNALLDKKSQLFVNLPSFESLQNKEHIKGILIHLLNNAISHGIEPALVRENKNKYPIGTIKIFEEKRDNNIIFHVVDDGSGIDFDKIKQKAHMMGLNIHNFNNHQLLSLIFEPNFSTNSSIDFVSGRGIGLNVVKTEIEKLGGRFGVKMRNNFYTDFYFSLPKES